MDIAKIREMSDRELVDALRQSKQELWDARFQLSTRQLNDTSSIPLTRRDIARILTVQRERSGGIVHTPPVKPKAERGSAKGSSKAAAKAPSKTSSKTSAKAGEKTSAKAGAKAPRARRAKDD
jgi:large subunit ribosomal protein L29